MQASSDLEQFARLLARVTDTVGDRPLDDNLEKHLEHALPANSEMFQAIFAACRDAVAAGWMCNRSGAGIRFGRVIKPQQQLGRYSVDVVEMDSIVGPNHAHPNGEIDMIMPIDPAAKFDGKGGGWRVYPPLSHHSPTVTDGKALVLYLLPDGAIDFKPA